MKTKWMMIPMVLLMMGCTREKEYGVSYIDGEFTLYANFGEHETRTQLQQDGSVFWNPGDCINVFYGSLSGKFASSNTEPSDYAEFTGLLGSFTLDGETEFVAAYPYSEQTSLSDGTLRVSLPSEQVAVEGSFADDLFISVAKSKDYNLYFYNVCGGVKFSVADEGIKKVVFRGNGGESLAGRLSVGFSDGKPQVSDIDGGKTSVTLTAPDDGTFKPGAFYYFVLAPQALQNGYTMAFYSDVLEGTVSIDSPVTIRRSAWGVLRDLVPEPAYIPDAVDLGLPSGLKWASCNLGATKPEECGDYYAWGETEPKSDYSWDTYKFGDVNNLTKYSEEDNELEAEDDAATQTFGDLWRMPTRPELEELMDNCDYEWTEKEETVGLVFTSRSNGRQIFLPASGRRTGTALTSLNERGSYWTSTLRQTQTADYLLIYDEPWLYANNRCNGFSIRPVYGPRGAVGKPVLDCSPDPVNFGNVSVGSKKSMTVTIKNTGDAILKFFVWSPRAPFSAEGYSYYSSTQETLLPGESKDVIVSFEPTELTEESDWLRITSNAGNGEKNVALIGRGIEGAASTVATPEIVDLGLSVKWASFNLGATRPEERGDYYAWGETEPYYLSLDPLVWKYGMTYGYDWRSYQWGGDFYKKSLTKYCTNPEYGLDGFTDGKVELDLEDDAAHVNLGGNWRMPTISEITELMDKCDWQWTSREGVDGYLVTSMVPGYTDRFIFLPPTGNWYGVNPPFLDDNGDYWSSSLYVDEPNCAYQLYFYSRNRFAGDDFSGYRYLGYPIRPVYDDSSEMPEIEVTPTDIDFGAVPYGTSSTKYVTVKNIGTGVLTFSVTNVSSPYSVETNADGSPKNYSLSAGESMQLAFTFTPNSATYMGGGRCTIVSNATVGTISVTYSGQGADPGQIFVPEAVDLGLPSGLKWASFNLGATRPDEYGDYYAWGETEPCYSSLDPLTWKPGKEDGYWWSSYNWSIDSYFTLTKYCTNPSYGHNDFTDGKTVLDSEDDAARVNLGGDWRMPTDAEWTELREKCTWTWTSWNGVNGREVTGPNGKSIFLPAAGWWIGTDHYAATSGGYRSLSLDTDRPYYSWSIIFDYEDVRREGGNRCNGQSVRPVYGKPIHSGGGEPSNGHEGGPVGPPVDHGNEGDL